ncbi:MAG: ABC transporter permease [Verrucomicrobia bacterium]|nr:ABC transporter permease [Verrucomicrobiota bacterium]
MRHIRTISKRELISYFSSPVAYVFIVIFLILCGFFTLNIGRFFESNQATLAAFFFYLPWLYLFLVPAIGMRLWSEERRMGTMELLLTMPVTSWRAILGKFLASWLFLALALVLTFPLVITVNYLGDPDNGMIVSGYVGGILLSGGFLAVGSMTSALTRNQVVSFILSVIICLFLILAGFAPVTEMLEDKVPWLIDLVSSFSVMTHYYGMQRGVINLRDVIFFLSLIVFALFCTGVIIRSHRA